MCCTHNLIGNTFLKYNFSFIILDHLIILTTGHLIVRKMRLFIPLWTLTLMFIACYRRVSSRFIPNTECIVDTLDPCKNHPLLPSSVFCNNIEDIRTFIRVMRCGSRRKMNEIFLEYSTLESIPLIVMDFCGVFILNMRNVKLKTLFEDPEDAPIRLKQLHLDDVTSSDPWTWNSLSPLSHLERFSVTNMPVETVDNSLLAHLNKDLQSVSLTSTNTSSIADAAFVDFKDLVYVSIQNNVVETVKRGMFATPSKIKYFYFGKNRITWLPEDMFDNMPDLQSVALEDNMIAEIHEITFREIWHTLTSVLMEGNPLKCHCKMLWLAKKGSPAVLTGECYSPKAKYGKPLKDLEIADFQC